VLPNDRTCPNPDIRRRQSIETQVLRISAHDRKWMNDHGFAKLAIATDLRVRVHDAPRCELGTLFDDRGWMKLLACHSMVGAEGLEPPTFAV
jgi:hypothetical protein